VTLGFNSAVNVKMGVVALEETVVAEALRDFG
jgi:hypothetical protein